MKHFGLIKKAIEQIVDDRKRKAESLEYTIGSRRDTLRRATNAGAKTRAQNEIVSLEKQLAEMKASASEARDALAEFESTCSPEAT